MTVKKVESLKELNKALRKISLNLAQSVRDVDDDILKKLIIGANKIRNTAIESMRTGIKTGTFYRRKSVTHRASAPGEAPAIDRGELVRSILYDVDSGSLQIEVGAKGGAPYAPHLEFGTKDDSGEWIIEPRPFLGPAVKEHEDDILNDIGDAAVDVLSNAIRRAIV